MLQQAAKFTKEQAEIKQQTNVARQKQRGKLSERLAKRQQQLDKKHRAELETVAPQAAQLAEQHAEERAALAELQTKLTATQEELAAEKAKHQAALEALAAKHDEELRMQKVCSHHSRQDMPNVCWLCCMLTPLPARTVPQHKFDAMKHEFDELAKQKFDNVEREYFDTAAQALFLASSAALDHA